MEHPIVEPQQKVAANRDAVGNIWFGSGNFHSYSIPIKASSNRIDPQPHPFEQKGRKQLRHEFQWQEHKLGSHSLFDFKASSSIG